MRARVIYLVCWLVGCVLLFFCFFGRVDADGTTIGWLVATRDGWLWLTNTIYVAITGIGLIPWLVLGMSERREDDRD